MSFCYPGTSNNALESVTLTINKGEKIGIIGSTGSGKSTLHKLILGLYAPTSRFGTPEDFKYFVDAAHEALVQSQRCDGGERGRPCETGGDHRAGRTWRLGFGPLRRGPIVLLKTQLYGLGL